MIIFFKLGSSGLNAQHHRAYSSFQAEVTVSLSYVQQKPHEELEKKVGLADVESRQAGFPLGELPLMLRGEGWRSGPGRLALEETVF